MKFDFIRLFIAACVAALMGWLYYSLSEGEAQLPLAVVSGIETLLLLGCAIGLRFPEYSRSTVMMRTACVSGWLILLVINVIYVYAGVNTSFYIVNGIFAMLLLLIVNGIYRSKQ